MTRPAVPFKLPVALALCGVALCGVSLPAHAAGERFNAVVLSKFCNSAHGSGYDDGICAGYITGVADAMLLEPGMDEKLCLPRDVSTVDFSKLVTRYMARRPETRQMPGAQMLRGALLEVYGC